MSKETDRRTFNSTSTGSISSAFRVHLRLEHHPLVLPRCACRVPEGLAPSFLGKPTLKQDAKTATVVIEIAADPSPSLHWTKDGKELLNVDKIVTRFDRKGGNKFTISLDIKVRLYRVPGGGDDEGNDLLFFFSAPTESRRVGCRRVQVYALQ